MSSKKANPRYSSPFVAILLLILQTECCYHAGATSLDDNSEYCSIFLSALEPTIGESVPHTRDRESWHWFWTGEVRYSSLFSKLSSISFPSMLLCPQQSDTVTNRQTLLFCHGDTGSIGHTKAKVTRPRQQHSRPRPRSQSSRSRSRIYQGLTSLLCIEELHQLRVYFIFIYLFIFSISPPCD